jgi:micrococcal nuclease
MMRARATGVGPALLGLALVLGGVGCSIAPQGSAPEAVEVPGSAGPTGSPARVVRLVDGDSGWFEIGGEEVEVRLLGYNAPERFEGDGGPPSCNGAAAGEALAALLDDAGSIEVIGDGTDRFGRLLADLVVDGRSAVDLLVAEGRGLAIGDDDPTRRDLMREAADARRGLWGGDCGTPAAEGLQVAAVEPDPPGRDEDDLNGEWVELVNRGSGPIDLAGWDIRDDSSSHRFDLDAAGTLEPGDRLVIRTGSGSPGGGELFLDSPSPVWSNRADTVLVIDPAGVVAAWAFVG